MNWRIIFFILTVVLVTGCNNDDEAMPGGPDTGIALADEIVHAVLEPSIMVTSVDTILNHPMGGCLYALPADSVATASIDLNQDGIADFTLECSSWFIQLSSSSPCVNYNRSIVINGIGEQNQVSSTKVYNEANLFSVNDSIHSSGQWTYYGIIMAKDAYLPVSLPGVNGFYYLGLRMGVGADYSYGWIYFNYSDLTVTLSSYAYNATAGNSILAGQVE